MRWLVAAIVILVLAAGGYYFFLYPPRQLERQTEKILEQMDAVVATHDRAKISEALKDFFTPDAKIRLEVSFFSIAHPDAKPAVQDFATPEVFRSFIDNILYTMTDYSSESELNSFTLAPDHKTAALNFTGREWADGASWYGGTSVNVRFGGDTHCEGQVVFNDRPRLSQLACSVHINMVPKPGQEDKFRSPQMLMDLLK